MATISDYKMSTTSSSISLSNSYSCKIKGLEKIYLSMDAVAFIFKSKKHADRAHEGVVSFKKMGLLDVSCVSPLVKIEEGKGSCNYSMETMSYTSEKISTNEELLKKLISAMQFAQFSISLQEPSPLRFMVCDS